MMSTTTLARIENRTMQPTATLRDPYYCKVKVRKAHQPHEYVVPSDFATIPQNPVQSRIIRSAHHSHHRKRFFCPPAIKEETNEGEEDDSESCSSSDADSMMPKTPTINDESDESDENIPLALLAYRKGYIMPSKADTAFPLIQHIPSHNNLYQPQPHSNLLNSSSRSKSNGQVYPVPPISPVYAVPQHQYAFHTGGVYSSFNNPSVMKTPPTSPLGFSQQGHSAYQRKYSYSSTSSASVSSSNSSCSGSVPSPRLKTAHRSR